MNRALALRIVDLLRRETDNFRMNISISSEPCVIAIEDVDTETAHISIDDTIRHIRNVIEDFSLEVSDGVVD